MDFLKNFGGAKCKNDIELRNIFCHPFHKNRNDFFKNKTWNIFKLENDFFIEKCNYDLLTLIFNLVGVNSFFLSDAHSYGKMESYEMNKTIDLNTLREFIDERPEFFIMDWYIFDCSNKWGGIIDYELDSFYLGLDVDLSDKLNIDKSTMLYDTKQTEK